MQPPLVLASGSEIRADLLRRAAVRFEVVTPLVDEDTIREALSANGVMPRDVAVALAEAKARKAAQRFPDRIVIGCDQVLEFQGEVLNKPNSPADALAQLKRLRGQRHTLLSAAVVFECGEPVWRHVGQVRLWMREASDDWLADYVERNWDSIRHAVGCYKLEEEGVRLFSKIEGDFFNVLGLPLIELLSWLTMRGTIPG